MRKAIWSLLPRRVVEWLYARSARTAEKMPEDYSWYLRVHGADENGKIQPDPTKNRKFAEAMEGKPFLREKVLADYKRHLRNQQKHENLGLYLSQTANAA